MNVPGKPFLGPTHSVDVDGRDLVELDASTRGALGPQIGFHERYEVLGTIGSGGMGEVKLCRDRTVGREVAMKIIRQSDTGSPRRWRFVREARIQGQLEHPAVVPVYDFGVDPEGNLYFTMKRVRGVSLAEVIEALAAGANDYVLKRDDIRVVVARIEAQLQLRRAMAELQQARRLEAVGQLAGGMAHEINTPLQYIGDNAAFVNDAVVELLELLEQYAQASGELPSTARDALTEQLDRLAPFHRQLPQAVEEITRGVERVAEVINALRTFATPTGGQQANTDLPELLRTAVTVSRNVWQVVADLQLELDPAARDVVCDRQQLGQVIAGLLVNAAQAHEAQRQGNADAPRGHITLRTRRDDHDICIEVADDGPGIPPGLEQRIFDPFFTTQPVGKATGQGLALCEAVMRQHGGTVSVQSALGQGATFTLRLPQR
ncbi:MAG: protein kinase [Myxococcales bacterium]|nr:protein kinase [Myxococcales bacterium]